MSTGSTDRWGVPIQSEDPRAVPYFNAAVEELVSLSGDPISATENAVGSDDGLILGHILLAYLNLYATSPGGVSSASRILEDIVRRGVPLDEREILHLRAAQAWASGQWIDATHALERALLHEPRDLLALRIAQDLYFFLGQTADLRGVVARVVSAWKPDHPGWGYVQGMYAFGLEENAEYRKAEEFAQIALASNRLDVWATHALAHVFEMEGRTDQGIAFLTQSSDYWQSSYFAVHNWWHLALYYLERGEEGRALALYDGAIRGTRSNEWLDIVDAASLLWRLSLIGVDVSERAVQLSLDIEPLVAEPLYIFNDWHAVMAFGLAGRGDLTEQLITRSQHAVGSNRVVTEMVGRSLLEGFQSFANARFDRSVDHLARARPSASAVGGSNAQRGVIELTLVAAATRSGQTDLVTALVAERPRRKSVPSRAGKQP